MELKPCQRCLEIKPNARAVIHHMALSRCHDDMVIDCDY
jgi:hypothetical protein